MGSVQLGTDVPPDEFCEGRLFDQARTFNSICFGVSESYYNNLHVHVHSCSIQPLVHCVLAHAHTIDLSIETT